MHSYRSTKVQAFKSQYFDERVPFCENIIIRIEEETNFLRNIIWTDESKFSRKGVFYQKTKIFGTIEIQILLKKLHFKTNSVLTLSFVFLKE